ncbi:MAG: cell division protein FtsL [Gammaproteobacteria bacterium]
MTAVARKVDERLAWKVPVVDAGHLIFRTAEQPASVWSVLKPWHQGILVIMTIVVVFSALSVVLVQHIYRQQLRSFHVQMNTRDALNRAWSQLLVEQSAWGALDHVETAARSQLHMVIPDLSQVTFLQAPPLQASSLQASSLQASPILSVPPVSVSVSSTAEGRQRVVATASETE